jgi:hypothetical protein
MKALLRATRITLQGLVIVGLLAWGTYGTLLTQTSPSDRASILTQALQGEYRGWATGTMGGTPIQSGTGVQYILTFETNVPANMQPSFGALAGGRGYTFGPFLWNQPSATASLSKTNYAVFTYTFDFVPGFQGCCLQWFSGPQGNMTQTTSTGSYGGLEAYGSGVGWSTSILEADAAGNYTMHFFNTGTVGNATGRVAMGPSAVAFSRTQPYFYEGVASWGLAASFVATALVSRWRVIRPSCQPRPQ